MENYKDVDVPEDVVPELEQMDKDFLEEEDKKGAATEDAEKDEKKIEEIKT